MARNCGFMPYHNYAVETEPGYAQLRRTIEAAQMSARVGRLTEVVTIPVVVHVLASPGQAPVTDDQIRGQMEVLNEDFRARNADLANIPEAFRDLADDAGIAFRLASRDPLGRPTTGINRVETAIATFPSVVPEDPNALTAAIDAEVKVAGTGAAAWPRNEYLNFWVCNMGRNPLGYAAFPGSAAWRDGVVIDFTCFGTGGSARPEFDRGRTAVHETGHWLDLLHIWGDDGGACNVSDNVADTPNQGGPNFGTPNFPSASCNNAPNGDLFMNFMDYVDDPAMFMFTVNQVDRMHAALQGPRRSLLVSRGLDDAGVAVGEPRAFAAAAMLDAVGQAPGLVFDGVGWIAPAALSPPL